MFDYRKLRKEIANKFKTQAAFAQAMEWSERTLSLKLNGKRFWKQPEICKAIHILEVPAESIQEYFFTYYVQNIELKSEVEKDSILASANQEVQ
ncbi:DUF739 family protein [Aminipila butyrica]|uniref:DUF739 family protein n=1 Tax=Aminipila butyrica TaxID=433296 RepID=UPI001FE9AF38|nr:DUF739 family protein [Aminipila butyrica]